MRCQAWDADAVKSVLNIDLSNRPHERVAGRDQSWVEQFGLRKLVGDEIANTTPPSIAIAASSNALQVRECS